MGFPLKGTLADTNLLLFTFSSTSKNCCFSSFSKPDFQERWSGFILLRNGKYHRFGWFAFCRPPGTSQSCWEGNCVAPPGCSSPALIRPHPALPHTRRTGGACLSSPSTLVRLFLHSWGFLRQTVCWLKLEREHFFSLQPKLLIRKLQDPGLGLEKKKTQVEGDEIKTSGNKGKVKDERLTWASQLPSHNKRRGREEVGNPERRTSKQVIKSQRYSGLRWRPRYWERGLLMWILPITK